MTTVPYVAVSVDGMGTPAEIYMHPAVAPGLARIADVVQEHDSRTRTRKPDAENLQWLERERGAEDGGAA